MRIYVCNLKRMGKYLKRTSFIACVLLIALLFIGLFNNLLIPRLYVSASAEETSKSIVIIDAGHGGEDSGAVGTNGVLEKELNLEIAFKVGELLRERGFTVIYTREDDKLLYRESENIKGIRKISDLKNRCEIARSYEGAIFVSIHMNSFGSSKYSGLQVYYADNEGAARLAGCIRDSVREQVQPDNKRAIKKGKNIYVLENSLPDAVLIECGFLTNMEECQKLSEKEYQNKLSFAIVCGIIDYRNVKDTNQ